MPNRQGLGFFFKIGSGVEKKTLVMFGSGSVLK